ncbi:MAG: TetR/AcrR family transcriptional regulator [Nocardioidaceae bacterium]|nr:TetR/AcrR family transcriptional regulator [Nocardioidaceae bacterium]
MITAEQRLEQRRPRVTGDREGEVLDAAVRVLADVGYDRLTMDQVAAEAHASKATLYRRWSTKAELVVDAVSRGKGLPDPTVIPDTGTLRGDLVATACGKKGWTAELPMSVLGGVMTALHTDEELSTAFRERFLAPRMQVTRALFERARTRGEIPADVDLDLVYTVLPALCSFHEFALGSPTDDRFVRRVIDHVVIPSACRTADGPTH